MEGEGRSGSHEDRPLQAKVMDRKAWSWGGEGSSPFWSEQGRGGTGQPGQRPECRHTWHLHSGLRTVWPHIGALRCWAGDGPAR